MATKVEQLRDELNAKRGQLKEIFDRYPNLDMPETVVEDIRARNTELTDLGKKFDSALELEKLAGENAKALEAGNARVNGLPTNAKGAKQDNGGQKSLGQLFVESRTFKEYNRTSKSGPAVEIEIPGLWERKTLLDEATGYAPQAVRTGLILPGVLQRPMVADLIPQGNTGQTAVVYMEETTTTNAADTVAEGGTKPESALAFTERNSPVRKIATVLPITDELLQDEPAMRSYVEQRLRLFLDIAEETQLISGSGVAPDLTGMLNTVGIQTQAKGVDPTPDALYKAMVLVQTNSFLDPSGVIMHPLDWQDIRLLKTADGVYIWGSPADAGPERVWGLPIVKTTAMTQNTAIVAAFNSAMQIFRKSAVSFAISDQHSDFFIKNQVMLRVEERLAFVVYRPSGICTVTGI